MPSSRAYLLALSLVASSILLHSGAVNSEESKLSGEAEREYLGAGFEQDPATGDISYEPATSAPIDRLDDAVKATDVDPVIGGAAPGALNEEMDPTTEITDTF